MPSADWVADRAAEHAANSTWWGVGYCLRFVRSTAGAPAGTPDASTAWRNANHRHLTGTPPRGSFVYWTGGGHGYGHIAVSDGRGYCWSTDIRRAGRIDRYPIAGIVARWGNLTYQGWAEDVNGVRVTGLTIPEPVTVRLTNLRRGLRNDDVRDLQLALRRNGQARLNPSGATGYFGPETVRMVTGYQRTLGWSQDLGKVGPRTCALLGLHVT